MTEPRWWHRPYWGFDLETNGVDVFRDRIVTATLSRVFPDGGSPTESTTWVVDPGVEIPEGAAKLHGYTTERARTEGRPAAEAVPEILLALEDALASGEAVCAFNANFDLSMADGECRRWCGRPLMPIPPVVVDPYVIDKKVNRFVRGKGMRQLKPTAARWGVTLSEADAHSSEGDVLATVRTAYKQMVRTPWLGALDLRELHNLQMAEWFPEQTRSFADYKLRMGEPEEAERLLAEQHHWPLRPFVPQPV